jgi:hypothetical protein
MRRDPLINLAQERGLPGHDLQPNPLTMVLAQHQQEPSPNKHLKPHLNELENKEEAVPLVDCPVYSCLGHQYINKGVQEEHIAHG